MVPNEAGDSRVDSCHPIGVLFSCWLVHKLSPLKFLKNRNGPDSSKLAPRPVRIQNYAGLVRESSGNRNLVGQVDILNMVE
jgi:hypothetical protein